MVLKNKLLLLQIIRFGTIGSLAALVQLSLIIFLVELKLLPPLAANIIAFILAFQVSYWGHRQWTFQATGIRHGIALPRLFLTASSAFIANEFLFYITLNFLHLPYVPALILVLTILPVVTFIVSKFWDFR
jgi:putative flippase GtrA